MIASVVEIVASGHDMKSGVVIVEILWIGDFIFMFLGLDLFLYIVGYYLHCICHIIYVDCPVFSV